MENIEGEITMNQIFRCRCFKCGKLYEGETELEAYHKAGACYGRGCKNE